MSRGWYLREGLRLHCSAWLSGGRGRCHAWALKGKRRCKWHGGKSAGQRTAEGMARTVAAMKAGRLAWIARMQKAKAFALVERLPMGPRKAEARAVDGERSIMTALRELERSRAALSRS